MNYYEELGLQAFASVAEVRRAYKSLVRLLHPDTCRDEAQRRVAEAQLKRLNAIVAVLSDPDRKRAYDAYVVPDPAPPRPALAAPPPAPAPARHSTWWIWAGAGALVVSAAGWFFTMDASRPLAASEAAAAPTIEAPTAERRIAKPLHAHLDPQPHRSSRARLQPPPVLDPEPVSAPAVAVPEWAGPPAPQPAAPPAGRFDGTWLFAQASSVQTAGVYAPEYIELTLVTKDGRLRGSYRARYRVRNRAISPAVAFTFEGPLEPPEDRSQYIWEGAGGARGRIEVTLRGANALDVNWWATDLGSLDLASGSAQLLRVTQP